jgi:hypothetical protein
VSDWADIALVGGSYEITSHEPSLDGVLTDTRLAWPSDAAIAGFIRAANRWSPDTPVPSALIAEWRARIIQLAYQRWWAQQRPGRRRVLRCPPGMPRRHRRAIAVLIEILDEPWARVGLSLLSAASAFQLWAAREAWRALSSPRCRAAPIHLLSPVLRYTHLKSAAYGPLPAETWDATELSPWHTAALNAVSPAASLALYERIEAASRQFQYQALDALIDELDRLGRAAILEHGEWLSERDPAPPRGLVPYLPAEIELAARKPALTDEPPPPGSKK